MRLVHFLFNYPLPLLIIIMDSALMTGDKSVSKQGNLKSQRSDVGRVGQSSHKAPDPVLQNPEVRKGRVARGLFFSPPSSGFSELLFPLM